MREVRRYKVRAIGRMSFVMKLGFITVGVGRIVEALSLSTHNLQELLPSLLMFSPVALYLAWSVWRDMRQCVEVIVHADGMMDFRTLLYTDTLAPGTIRSIRAARGASCVLEHEGGTIWLTRLLNDWEELLGEIRRNNPGMDEEIVVPKTLSRKRLIRSFVLLAIVVVLPYVLVHLLHH